MTQIADIYLSLFYHMFIIVILDYASSRKTAYRIYICVSTLLQVTDFRSLIINNTKIVLYTDRSKGQLFFIIFSNFKG